MLSTNHNASGTGTGTAGARKACRLPGWVSSPTVNPGMEERHSNDEAGTGSYEEVEYIEEVVYEEVSDEEAGEEEHTEPAAFKQVSIPSSAEPATGASPTAAGPQQTSASSSDTARVLPTTAAADEPATLLQPAPAPSPETKPATSADGAPAAVQGPAGTADELQAAKVAGEVPGVAAKLSNSWLAAAWGGAPQTTTPAADTTAGGLTATAGITPTAAASSAVAGITALTGSISTWWSNLDATLAAAGQPQEAGERAQPPRRQPGPPGSGDAGAAAAGSLQLPPGEHCLDSYPCALLQTYTCNHNTLTPPVEVLYAGTLHITSSRCLFQAAGSTPRAAALPRPTPALKGPSADPAGPSPPAAAAAAALSVDPPGGSPSWWLAVPHEQVAAASHGRGTRRHPAADQLQLAVTGPLAVAAQVPPSSSSGSSSGRVGSQLPGSSSSSSSSQQGVVVFTEFEGASGLDDALSLVEHCREEAANSSTS